MRAPPLTPSFPMEQQKKDIEVHNTISRRKDTLTFKGFPVEECSGSMTPPPSGIKLLWRPNNYRRRILLSVRGGSTLNSALLKRGVKRNSQNGLFFLPWKQIKIQVGPHAVVGIWSQNVIGGVKETFLIETCSSKDFDDRLSMKKEEIRRVIDDCLKSFLKDFKVCMPLFSPVWIRHEDWIKGEEYIDKLPRECIIHDTVFKKVYSEGVEFIGGINKEPTGSVKNYIKNRALEDFSPEIVKALNGLRDDMALLDVEPLNSIANRMRIIKENNLLSWYNDLSISQRKIVLGVD